MSKGKKGKVREAKVNTPIGELDQKESLLHYNAVLIEEQNSNFQLVLERMDVMSERMDILAVEVRENGKRLDSVDNRLSTLELAFRGLKDEVRGNGNRLATVEGAIHGLNDDMIDMERRICSKINRVAERGDSHECRITSLEASQ